VTVQLVPVPVTVQLWPPLEVTLELEMAPAGDLEAVHDTVAWALPPVAVTAVGTVGTPTVSELEAAEAADVPFELVAVTVNVYAVLAVSPVILHEVAGAVAVQVWVPLPPEARVAV
jgi:hypothetical protein